MSAWIVENGHIDVLVNALAEYGVVPSNSDFQAVGQELWRENHRSVNYRYSKRTRTPRYKLHTTEAPLHPVATLKAVGCYEYQTCEHSGWVKSHARDLCAALEAAILQRHPDLAAPVPSRWEPPRTEPAYLTHPVWKAAPWGYSQLGDAEAHVYDEEADPHART